SRFAGPRRPWLRCAFSEYPANTRRRRALPGTTMARRNLTLILGRALTWVGVSSMMGAINYVTTIVKMRAPGMTMFRMPLTVWALFIAALLQLFALPVLTAAGILQLLDRLLETGFFTLICLWFAALRGKFDEHNHVGIELGGLYWHFVDLVWVLLFTLVYLM
ncbi:MAG: hypothetical protein GY711_20070, partial [bacterium]|nr:hypothetical protein [bacterium]